MPFLLSRTDTPLVALGVIVDDAFTPGDTSAWASIWRAAYRTARGTGVPLQGRVRIAENMVARVIAGAPPLIESPVQMLTTLSLEYDNLQVFVDQSLADDSVVLE